MLNFAGDLGKMVAPPLVALVAIPFGWRTALIGLGVVGLVFSVVVWRLPVEQAVPKAVPKPRDPEATGPDDGGGWGITRPFRFSCLSLLGFIDSSTRGAALAFLPFVLVDKGLDPTGVAWLFSVLFVGGALGKFGCGRLGDRFGATFLIVATELVTVVALVLFPGAPLLLVPFLAIAFGFVLNGTSSVLYAAVADFVAEHRRARGYGLYYTLVNGASAIAPFLYGLLGDRQGLTVLFFTMAAVNALTVPLALALRPSVESASGHP
jgi:MFS family permease